MRAAQRRSAVLLMAILPSPLCQERQRAEPSSRKTEPSSRKTRTRAIKRTLKNIAAILFHWNWHVTRELLSISIVRILKGCPVLGLGHSFPAKHPFIRKLAVELPIVHGPNGVLSLKTRVLSPAAQLFIDSPGALRSRLLVADRPQGAEIYAVAHGRSWQIVLQKSPRKGSKIEMRNNEIEANRFLNPHYTSAHDLKSILRARMRKIVLQHNRHKRTCQVRTIMSLSEGFCCKTPLRVAGGLACEFLVVGLRCFPIEGVGAFGMCMQIQNAILTQTIFTMVAEWMMLAGRRARLVRGDPPGAPLAGRERFWSSCPNTHQKIGTDAFAAWMRRMSSVFRPMPLWSEGQAVAAVD